MSHPPRSFVALATLALAPTLALPDGGTAVPLLPAYTQECASCHTAFAPRLLPAASWQRTMENLSQHYGSDASVDAATQRALTAWLMANAARGGKRSEVPRDDRITASAWFRREHRELPAAAWRHAAVGSASNCSACHTRAAEGSYREREIRLPQGGPR